MHSHLLVWEPVQEPDTLYVLTYSLTISMSVRMSYVSLAQIRVQRVRKVFPISAVLG